MIRIGNRIVAGSADVDLSTVLKSLNKTGLSVWVGTQTEHDALAESVKNNEKTTFITYDTDEDIYLIIDTIVSYGKTWSSVKISSELAKKINASDVYTKEQVDEIINAKLASALKYKGAVNTTALLPGSAENGDTYFVKADGFMYAYNSTTSAWDALGTVADMTNYFTKTEITAMLQDKADKFQYDVLPTASSETVGVLLQYTGADTQDYKNGYFYKGIDNGDDTYAWELAKIGEYEDIIDDEITSVNTTWSSEKISANLGVLESNEIRRITKAENTASGFSIDSHEGSWITKYIEHDLLAGHGTFPSEAYDWVQIEQYKSYDFVRQICTTYSISGLTKTFTRGAWCNGAKIENAVWSAWVEIATIDELGLIPFLYNQSTDILEYALTCPKAKKTLVRIHSANARNNPFGVLTDTDFIYEIYKINDSDDSWISIKAKDVRTNREFLNTKDDANWHGWQELATMDKVVKNEITTTTFINSNNKIQKQGKMCTATIMNLLLNTTYNTGEVLGTIGNSAFYPKESIRGLVVQLNSGQASEIRINADGTITVGQATPLTSGYWVGNFSWVTN